MTANKSKNHIVNTLEKVGLGENEAILYSLLLKRPTCTAQELQTHSPFPRTMLYYVLNRLTQIGLVIAVKEEWRTVYIAKNPEHLYELLAEREREFQKDAMNIRELIPELKNQYRLAGKRPDVRMFEGIEGYKKALEDIIASKPDAVYAFSNEGAANKPGIEIRETHEKRRIAKKIQKHSLLFDNETAREELRHMAYNDYSQFRFISSPIAIFTVDMQLYSGKILYTTLEGRDPITLLLEDTKLYEMQRNFFNALWINGQDATLLALNAG